MLSRLFSLNLLHKFLALLLSFLIALQPALLQANQDYKIARSSASLDQLAVSPGLRWIDEIRHDPALTGKVDWRGVETQFEQWDYKAQGLTEAGAALVTLVVTALTAGSGGFTAGLTANLAAAMGIENVAMQAALQAQ